jgi:hypothetical protein
LKINNNIKDLEFKMTKLKENNKSLIDCLNTEKKSILILDEESPPTIIDTCEDWNLQTMV